MQREVGKHPWDELDKYRGSVVRGQWPTLPELLVISEDKFSDRISFSVFQGKEKIAYTFHEVLETAKHEAGYLRRMGIGKGDKVMLMGHNSPDWALAYFAIPFADAVSVPMDSQMRPDKCVRLAKFAEVKFIVADSQILSLLKAEDEEWFSSLLGVASLDSKSDVFRLSEAEDDFPPLPTVTEDDTAAILFTSGTTGNEKGVVLTHKNITSDVYMTVNEVRILSEKDVTYALLPLHHSYCCTAVLLETVKHGADCIFGHGIVVSRMIADMKQGKVSVFMGIPLLYNKVIAGIFKKVREKGALTYGLVITLMTINGWCKKAFGKTPFKKFFDRTITSQVGLDHSDILICGAGPLSPKVFKQYQQLGLNFLQGYGLTETSPILTLNPPSHFKVDSVGKVLPFIDMIIADKDSDGVGEIRVKGPNICKGYYKDAENTAALFDENGYLRTGDLGYLDSENYLYLKGRAKNIIVTEGGKNVFPEEIEDMFQLYQQIDQILIRGFQMKKDVPCECIEAVIYPSEDYYKGKELSKEAMQKEMEAIVTEVNRNLAGYKKIEKVTVVDKPMEMTTTKKIKRNLVK